MNWMPKTLQNSILKAKQETSLLNGWILVTPELAKELIKFNTQNYRVLDVTTALKYAQDMKSGLWQKNGEPIIFSKEGTEENGQHRLQGVIDSGVAVVMYMIFDADHCDIYDLQKKRTCVQVLRSKGVSVSYLVPAVARAMLLNGFYKAGRVGDAQICDYVLKHANALKKAESIVKTRIGKAKMMAAKAPCAAVAYCMLRTGEIPESELIDFFKVMNSNKKCGVKKDVSSALALRNQIDSYDGHSDSLNNRFVEYTYLALKDFHAGIAVTKGFNYPDGGKDAERLISMVRCMDGMCVKAA